MNITSLTRHLGIELASNPSHEFQTFNTFTTILKARNPAGTSSKLMEITIPQTLALSVPRIENKISGISYLESTQKIDNNSQQQLFAEKNILLKPGFQVNKGAIFKSEIKNGCQ